MTKIETPSLLSGCLVNLHTKDASGQLRDRGPRLIVKTAFGWGAELKTPGFYEMIDLGLVEAYWSQAGIVSDATLLRIHEERIAASQSK